MNTQQKLYDYLIVGQGLAGSTLAYTLLQHNKNVLVIDNGSQNTSSRVAAGIINPIVFKRLTLSWKVNTLLPFARQFYQNIEQQSGYTFFHKRIIYRFFSNQDEYNFWQQQCNEPHLVDYLSEPEKGSFNTFFSTPYGYGKVLQAGFLDTVLYLNYIKEFLISQNAYLQEEFDFTKMQMHANFIQYDNIKADKIIFCRGWNDAENPFFKSLNIFKLTKGEVLSVMPEKDIDFNDEASKGIFFIKHITDYKLGATYDWKELNTQPTDKAQTELLKKLHAFTNFKVTVKNHQAQIRPTVKDRRPVIGFLSKNPRVGIFNGLGTKGVMIAPWLARQFILSELNNRTVEKEISLSRFEKS
jgi:glycine/D-amino acid oxidase-like deaminating enzyme